MANVEEQDFAELYENSLKSLEEGSVVEGTVVDIVGDEIFVDLGYKADGIVPRDEFSYNEEEKPQDKYKKGDKIEAYIVRLNNGQGNVLLSTKRLETKKIREEFEARVKLNEPIKVKVTNVVNGGVTANFGNVKIFIPASQLGQKVENLDEYRGKNIEIKVIEYNPEKKKIVGSERVLVKAARDQAEKEVWAKVAEGVELEGTIREIKDYGCFVDLGGVDGLLHISEISWKPIHNPSEVFKVGDTVTVKVLSIDKENKKISLGYRKAEDNPWLNVPYEVGQVVEAEVVSLKPFGAFVALENGLEGLVHISNITHARIAKPQDVLQLGQKVTAKVIEVDPEKKRIELSIREMEERMPEENAQETIEGVDAKEPVEAVQEAPVEKEVADENQVTIDEVKNTEE
ncbi:MAG: 30S ribosomal protein S1 [Clostridia bacterium]|nr:30S ribosomal protein S1 [Clostridia bacterium]